MNSYRECSRNLWNVYFSRKANVGLALDTFGQVQELLFDSIVLSELSYQRDAQGEDIPPPVLRVVLEHPSLILIKRLTPPGQGGYWDEVRDMVVGQDEITLQFIEYFDFAQVPIQELRYCLCRILRFRNYPAYEGREALVEAISARIFHDEDADER